MSRIYLDYAADAPLRPETQKAMARAPSGNPGSFHLKGQRVSAAVFAARRAIAQAIGLTEPRGYEHIIFTGSATEANNLVLRGVLKTYMTNKSYRTYTTHTSHKNNEPLAPRILISAFEHESVSETAKDISVSGPDASVGADSAAVPVSKTGFIDLAKIRKMLMPETILVSAIYCQNEIGTIQPIAGIGKIISEYRKEVRSKKQEAGKSIIDAVYLFFHTDAAQAFAYFDCNPDMLGVDFMTISPHKFGGPQGIGILYARHPAFLAPIITGGGQEWGIRSGTENVAAIVGAAEAVSRAARNRPSEWKRVHVLSEKLYRGVKMAFPRVLRNGSTSSPRVGSMKNSAPHIVNIYIPGHNAHEMVVALDLLGIAASAGPACSARRSEPSRTIRAMGLGEKRAKESIRLSLGWGTTDADIDAAIKAFTIIAARKK